jgi:AsmA protein
MKRIAWILAAAAAATVLVLVLFLSLLPRDTLKRRVGEQIAAWTGRDVSLRGAPEIRFFPRLTVTLKDVQVAGPPAMKDASLVSMDRLTGTIRLLPLMIGRVEIGSFTMVHPVIHLVRDDRGARNWRFDSGAAALQLAFAGDVPLGRFLLKNGTILYENRQQHLSERFDSVNVNVEWESVRQPISISGGGIWRGEQVAFSGSADAPFAFLNGKSTPLLMRLDSAPITIALNGSAAGVDSPRLAGALNMATPSLRGFASWLGGSIGPGSTLGPASLSGAASFDNQVLSVENAELALDGNSASGALKVTASAKPAVTGTLAFKSLDLTPYFAGFIAALSPGKEWKSVSVETGWIGGVSADLRLSTASVQLGSIQLGETAASVSLKKSRLEIGIAQAAFNGGALAGDFTAAVSNTPGAAVSAKIHATDFNLASAAQEFALPSYLSGTATAAADVTSTGRNLSDFLKNLNGTAHITLTNASVPLFGIAETATALAAGRPDPDVPAPALATPVDSLFAGFSFGMGTAVVEQSSVTAPSFRADVKGWIALLDGSLGLNGTVQPIQSGGPGAAQAFAIEGSIARPFTRPLALSN